MNKLTKNDRVFRVVMFIIMTLFSISFIYMLLWLIVNSLKTPTDFLEHPFSLIPSEINWENYKIAFTYTEGRNNVNMLGMIKNTLIILFADIVLGVFFPALTGYAGAKFDTKIQKLMTTLVFITMVVPMVGTVSVQYQFINKIGLYDNFWGIFLMKSGGMGFAYLMFKNFFAAVPWDYAESAYMDGAGNFKIFVKIMLPQAIPLAVGQAIIVFINCWNDYFTAYMYLPSYPTVALGINNLYSKLALGKQNYPAAFAAMVFATVVVLVPYAFCNKTIMESMSVGGLKG